MARPDFDALPGGEFIQRSLEDLAAGIESDASLLVSIGAPRLRRLGARWAAAGLTCFAHATKLASMSRMIQIRHVPEELHRTLKARAAAAGMSLSDYLLTQLRVLAERPTLHEMRERLHRREPVTLRTSAARAVRAERDAR